MPTSERESILRTLSALVEPLNRTLTDPSEIALHDLANLPNSVVAIAGRLTGRKPGDRAPESLIEAVREGRFTDQVGNRTEVESVEMRSTTIFIRDSEGIPFAALCIHFDVTLWLSVRALAEAMLHGRRRSEIPAPTGISENIVHDIDELAGRLLDQAIRDSGVPVELMQKRHKLIIVRDLRTRGFFTLRESVETAAKALGVSRFTVYNYLNEIENEIGNEPGTEPATRHEPPAPPDE